MRILAGQRDPLQEAGRATHVIGMIVFVPDQPTTRIWSLAIGDGNYSARSWAMTSELALALSAWIDDHKLRLATDPAPQVPTFSEPPTARTIVSDRTELIAFFGEGNDRLDQSARDLLHILYPAEYPNVMYNERPCVLDMVAVRK